MFLSPILVYFASAANFLTHPSFLNPFPLLTSKRTTTSFTGFVESQRSVALEKLLNNVGAVDLGPPGVKSGLVVASPSTTNPDYFYTWTRDSALTLEALVDAFVAGNASLESEIQSYVYSQAQLQTVSNPSGDLSDGAGLGEPKFEVDGTPFTGNWGRPQRDGPALRAIALITYANWLLSNGNVTRVETDIWPMISNDLSYVAQYWNQSTFDLWEETEGSSFFTTAVQYRALIGANMLAQRVGKTCPGCISQAPQLLCLLQDFWNGEYILGNININHDRSGKDVNTILASIHNFDPSAACDDLMFQPCSPRALANHKVTTDSFRTIFTINSGIASGSAVAAGRYPGDIYQGGNPWYLTTLASAELLYCSLHQWSRIQSITITPTSLPFFQDFIHSITPGTYPLSSSTYTTLTTAIRSYADGFLRIVQRYTPPDGSLAEQFSRNDGTPVSAGDLTWSYVAFLTAVARRNGQVPASWGASSAVVLAESCHGDSAPGTYVTPTATTPSAPCSTVTSISVVFNVVKATVFGETVYLAGSIPRLGSWDPANAVALSAVDYQSQCPRWFVGVDLPPGVPFEYKFFIRGTDGGVIWEGGSNRGYDVPSGCAAEVYLHDVWQ